MEFGMRISGLLKTLPVVIVIVLGVTAQERTSFEYGEPEELRGVKKIFVDTGADLKARNAIVKEITKKLPTLIISESQGDDDVVLVYNSTEETRLIDARTTPVPGTNSTRTKPVLDTVRKGTGYVAKKISSSTLRILVSFEGANDHLFSKSPEIGFAQTFIKAYKKANK